jgi:hypothetical protein
VALARVAYPEVQVRAVGRSRPSGADRSDGIARIHVVALSHGGRRQVQVRGVVPTVRGSHAHREPRRTGAAGEPHLSAGGGDHRRAEVARDVDATVLAAGIGIVTVAERRDHLASERPNPGRPRRWREDEQCGEGEGWGEDEAAHDSHRTAELRGVAWDGAKLLRTVAEL